MMKEFLNLSTSDNQTPAPPMIDFPAAVQDEPKFSASVEISPTQQISELAAAFQRLIYTSRLSYPHKAIASRLLDSLCSLILSA